MIYQEYVEQCRRVVEEYDDSKTQEYTNKSFIAGNLFCKEKLPIVKTLTVSEETEHRYGIYEWVITCKEVGKDTVGRNLYLFSNGLLLAEEYISSKPGEPSRIEFIEPSL